MEFCVSRETDSGVHNLINGFKFDQDITIKLDRAKDGEYRLVVVFWEQDKDGENEPRLVFPLGKGYNSICIYAGERREPINDVEIFTSDESKYHMFSDISEIDITATAFANTTAKIKTQVHFQVQDCTSVELDGLMWIEIPAQV